MILEIMRAWKIRSSACSDRFLLFKLGKKIQTLVTYSNDVIYVLFRGEGSGKGNSKDLGRGDPFNAGNKNTPCN